MGTSHLKLHSPELLIKESFKSVLATIQCRK